MLYFQVLAMDQDLFSKTLNVKGIDYISRNRIRYSRDILTGKGNLERLKSSFQNEIINQMK